MLNYHWLWQPITADTDEIIDAATDSRKTMQSVSRVMASMLVLISVIVMQSLAIVPGKTAIQPYSLNPLIQILPATNQLTVPHDHSIVCVVNQHIVVL
jgi:hypothetical protein